MIVIGCSNSVQFGWWFAQPTQSCFALGEENFPYAEIPQNLGFGLLKRGKVFKYLDMACSCLIPQYDLSRGNAGHYFSSYFGGV